MRLTSRWILSSAVASAMTIVPKSGGRCRAQAAGELGPERTEIPVGQSVGQRHRVGDDAERLQLPDAVDDDRQEIDRERAVLEVGVGRITSDDARRFSCAMRLADTHVVWNASDVRTLFRPAATAV